MENHMLVFAVVMSFISTLYGETKPKVGIGVILDTETSLGKMSRSCISMALGDFYKKHDNYTTRIVPHFRDSKQDNVEAASVAIDIGSKSSVPIISPATSPSLTPNDKPYFIRSSHDSSSQLKPIAELIKHFGWREVVFIYEDGDYGRGLFPYIADAMVNVDAKVMYRTVIYHSASDDWILKELYKMKTMQTRVFIVHALPDLATRFFKKVNEAGMMEEGYAWIITEVLTSSLHSLDHTDIDSMQGVLAIALEKVASGINFSTNFKRQPESMTDVDGIGISEMGPRLIPLIRNIKLNGLSGDFYLVDGQLQPSVYQIVNILDKGLKHVSYWTPTNGIRKKLHQMKGSKDDLRAIIWPGDTTFSPKGWEIPTSSESKLRVGVPARRGFAQFVDVNIDPKTRKVISVTGFCIDIFTRKMPFGLKNAGSTYQRLVDKAFQRQIGRNLEVYVDDLVIKSHTEEEIIRDITETFKTLRQINMKLNPKKCTFGMQEGMFLGYKVSTHGLRACPEKADTVLSLPSPRCIKDVQKLNGKLASLNRFLSKSAEKSLPFFKTLKKCTKKSDFQWTPEAEEAFKQMKKLIAELPTLTAPREHEELIIYLAAAKEAISAVLMTDREGRQIPVYFVSRTLRGPEVNYTPMEKLVLALLSASKRLKRYFQAHTIVVVTNQPIKQLLSSSEISGRMLKWKFELEGYDIQYRPRTAIKGQILADFIVERPEDESSDKLMTEPEVLPEPWTLFTDGSSCVDGSGAGLILTNPEGTEFTYAMRFRFEATNNEAEYEALIAGLRIAEQMGVKNLQANVDSRLVANQVNGSYIAKESGMVQYLNKVKTLAKSFKEFSIKQIPRSENKKADALSKIASTSFAHLNKQVLVEELKEKSINEKEILDVVEEEGNTWMTPICEYLAKEILPEDKKKARAVRRKAARIIIAAENLTPITSPWPFYKWGIDIAGPFPEGPGKVKFLIVAIDYFTKWIEAKAVATITGNQVKKFVWDNIVCRFGLPGEIISDNGKQFRDNPFKDWCEKLCIRQCFASVKHPQANGLVERANRSLGEGIKARLDEKSKDWIEELPHVLWAHRTMIKSSNGETPFSLTYGTEAVIPAEIGMPTLRTAEMDQTKNNEALGINLDLIEERREQAAIQEAKSKKKMEKYYNSRVRGTSFKPGDMVYRSNEASHAKDEGKLGPKWEGPYEVKESLGKGAYKLKDCKGNEIPRTWNICNLKKCYIHEL
ncbi:reverse transcriptase domain-containing protein [Tanacetum coccineum]